MIGNITKKSCRQHGVRPPLYRLQQAIFVERRTLDWQHVEGNNVACYMVHVKAALKAALSRPYTKATIGNIF
jgi:hypothetical protein